MYMHQVSGQHIHGKNNIAIAKERKLFVLLHGQTLNPKYILSTLTIVYDFMHVGLTEK